jgi:hypothetical protein
LSGSRRKWQDLIENLVSEMPQSLSSPAPPVDHFAKGRKNVDIPVSPAAFRPQSCNLSLEGSTPPACFGPEDDETMFQWHERLYRITQVMERLAKVEKQNHKILVLIFALTITAFIFLLMDANLHPKSGVLQMAQIPGPTIESGVKAGAGPDNPATKAAAGKYVGVKTSNEYHLPDCEAARTGAPEVLATFKSVAEAKRQGFKPCPLCQPPKTD